MNSLLRMVGFNVATVSHVLYIFIMKKMMLMMVSLMPSLKSAAQCVCRELIPFVVAPGLYIGVDLAVGPRSGCSDQLAVAYDLYYGLKLSLGLDAIVIKILSASLKLSGSILPKYWTLELIQKVSSYMYGYIRVGRCNAI